LVEFPSVVEAVACSLAVQRGMSERNAAIPADQRIELRIGVNLGDVIVEEGDIHGDGVNIAARLEGIAEPGGDGSEGSRVTAGFSGWGDACIASASGITRAESDGGVDAWGGAGYSGGWGEQKPRVGRRRGTGVRTLASPRVP
jgi:hypothetical protein